MRYLTCNDLFTNLSNLFVNILLNGQFFSENLSYQELANIKNKFTRLLLGARIFSGLTIAVSTDLSS